MSSYSGKRLCDMMDDGLDDLLSQAVDPCEKEEVDLDDGFDGILSQSLDRKVLMMTLSISQTCLRVEVPA